MSNCKIGDLVRYASRNTRDEFGRSPSFEVIGIVIDETCVDVSDRSGTVNQYSYLTIFWSDGSLSHSAYEEVPVLECLTSDS